MSTLNFIHAITGDFNAAVFAFLKSQEGFVPRIYLDGKNIPTLGVGYALAVRNATGQYVRRSDAELAQQMGAMGITLIDDPQRIDDDVDILNAAVNALNGTPVPSGVPTIAHWNPQNPDPANTPFSFGTITEPQFQPLFNLLVDEATITLIAKIGQPTFSALAGSDEMVALLSMTFNSPNLIGSKLIGALQGGNRAEAWYEIRYQSNKERLTDPAIARGIANRRYAESDKFGLYENSLLSESEARTIFRMYTAHRDAIHVYENDARTVPSSTDSFVYESQAARALLITTYAQFAGAPVVGGEVLVGSSIGEFDSLPGNDLILGEARYNNLHGEKKRCQEQFANGLKKVA